MIESALLLSVLPTLLAGAWLTLKLTVGVVLVGTVLAFQVALCRNGPSALPRAAANGYILFFRGTPALVQLFLLYYGAGQFDIVRHSVLWPVLREPFWCVILALGLNSAAYTGKTLAAALKAVPHGYQEAAHVLGLSRLHTFVLIELPLAVRLALPALGNEIILTC
ncbi:MAG: ABC transporter permease subunit, partial [Comamonadaceae bacterium]